MLKLSIPWWEFVLRGIIVYFFLILILRLSGKRQIGQMAPFDLALLMVLSNAVQDSINGGDNSLIGGLISAITLVLCNYFVGMAIFKSKTMENIIDGRPQILIHNGRLFQDVMDNNQLTHHELNAALRMEGLSSIEDVHYAVLENNGQITIRAKKQK